MLSVTSEPTIMESCLDYPVTRTGNLQRSKWRWKCRQILADHLSKVVCRQRRLQLISYSESTLGVVIEPAQVRLKPDIQDGYMWNALLERQHLFTKQLSKHSVRAYMELCREVGKSFEAVAQENLGVSLSDDKIEVR
jgi:hypothetical protein